MNPIILIGCVAVTLLLAYWIFAPYGAPPKGEED